MKKDIILREFEFSWSVRLPPRMDETGIELTGIPYLPIRKVIRVKQPFGKKIPHKSMWATLPVQEVSKKIYGYVIPHLDHKHRSKEETLICEWLQYKYGASNVRPNYKVRNHGQRIEIDFAILKDGVIDFFVEYHPNKGFPTDRDYAERRKRQIKTLYGIVGVVVMDKLPKIVSQEYYTPKIT